MSALVRATGLTKTFALAEAGGKSVSLVDALFADRGQTSIRTVNALRDVSFEIREGERVGVIGRNGAGKTTLLSLLAGITGPSSGHVEIVGDVHAMLTIGAVLRDEATGRENIYLDGVIHGRGRDNIDVHVDEVIAFSELGEFIDRPVRTYSSGMKARLAFSMGTFIEPDILIIDETLSVGDTFFSAKASRRMKEITAQGRIVIVVSHALRIIDDICNRCIWLDQGVVVMDGPAREVTRAYEKAVEQADEMELIAKFEAVTKIAHRSEQGCLRSITIEQEGKTLAASARAFIPLRLVLSGEIRSDTHFADIRLSIVRVDGRRISSRRLSDTGEKLLVQGPFSVTIDFDPLILGAGLYRFDVAVMDEHGDIDATSRVLEILDDEGQFGGLPLLYYPPIIVASRVGEAG
jgi:lipopolysaccharide transport system ATP-binding protein